MKKVILLLLAVLLISTVFVGCNQPSSSSSSGNTGSSSGGNSGSSGGGGILSKLIHLYPEGDIVLKVNETKTFTARIMDKNGQALPVDNSKFKWFITAGGTAISIVPNGNTVKITGNRPIMAPKARIRVEYPDGDYALETIVVVHRAYP